VIRELLTSPEISFDYETEALDPYTGARIICIGLSPREGTAYCIPLETELAPWTFQEKKDIYRLLGAVLSNPRCIHSAFNSSFELKWSKHRGIPSKCDYDPMVAAGLLDENLPHDLGTSVQMYVDPDFVKLDSSKISTWPWDKVWNYNSKDADYNLRLAHALRPRLEQEPSSQKLYDNLLHPFQTKVLPKLELGGIYVHMDKLQQAEERCIPERDKHSKEVLKYVPEDYVLPVKSKKSIKRGFNPGSPKQLSDLLFNVLGLPDNYDGSTAEAALVDLKGKHPIMVPIMEFRKYEKLLDFLESWKLLRDSKGFIHPHYHLLPTTGRLSCTNPNLQQTPRVLFIRNVLGAPPGYVLLMFDYSQIELRIVAHYAQDPEMMKAFLNHEDIHWTTALSITSGGDNGLLIKSAEMYCLRHHLPANWQSSKLLCKLWTAEKISQKDKKKRISPEEILRESYKAWSNQEAWSRQWGESGERKQLTMEWWVNSMAGQELQEETMRGLWEYTESLSSSQESELLGLESVKLDNALSLLSLIGPSVAQELSEEWKEIRKKAKAINFGLVFEMGAHGLVRYAKEKYEVDLTLEEATLWRGKFFKKYNQIPLWHRKQIKEVHLKHQVVSMIGRIRHLSNILSSDADVVAEAERQSINSIVQGLASDFNLMSAVEAEKILPPKDGWCAGLVHDESIYVIKEDRADYWKDVVKGIMENPPLERFTTEKFSVPIEVEVEVGKYWS